MISLDKHLITRLITNDSAFRSASAASVLAREILAASLLLDEMRKASSANVEEEL